MKVFNVILSVFVLLFAVVCSCIPQTKYYPYVYSFLEITGGINIISNLNIDESLKLSLISFFLSFSGMSVILQVCSIIIPAGLSIKPYITGKLIQGTLSFYITKILLIYFQPYKTYTVFSPMYEKILPDNMWNASLTIVSFAVIGFLILMLIGKTLESKRNK